MLLANSPCGFFTYIFARDLCLSYILTLNLEMECNFGSPEGSLAFGADLHAVYEDYFMPRSESTSDLSDSGSEASSKSDENASESRSSRSRRSLVVLGRNEDELEEVEVREFVF